MKLLDRYIGSVVLAHCGVVLVVLLAIYAFTAFVTEIDYVGQGKYAFSDAALYVLMLMPRQAYELFPMVALLGTMLGLGALASTSELTVIRAAGVSIRRMTLSVFKIGLVMVLAAVVLGEVVAPPMEKYARIERAKLLSKNISINADDAVWVRDESTFINIHRLLPNGVATGIAIYRFDADRRLAETVAARKAEFKEGAWVLDNVRRSVISKDNVITTARATREVWRTGLTPEVFRVAAVPPENLSAWDLYRFVVYLRSNGLESQRYELAFWIRIITPFATAGMVLMALPFVFGSLRSVSIGQRILVGALLGIGFYLFNAIFSRFGVVYELSPFVSAALPTVMVFAIWGAMMRRIR